MGKKKGGGMVRIKQTGPTKAQKDMMKQMASGNPMEEFMTPPEDMVHYIPPDRNAQMFWPIQEIFSMDPSNFFIIYPSYLDSSKTVKMGRRIAAENAVDTPTVQDISEALASLSIRHVSQPNKGYSRDATTLWDNPGRVKVDPAALESGYTKRSLMVELASIIKELPSRARRLEVMKKLEEAREAKRLEAKAKKEQAAKQQHKLKSQTSSRSSNKKKGKKRR
ncbi:unnamed protein product [Pseudo-nitzschia multistriata]|uniref:Signal recognition particle SRP19 subunit n=1 Tax=Pseudo-nitzschia multistriata TaxID=183589 RepID=A0A448Z059_9STRA|nr:unnamed protein product [Pseudo-nitzschia multistriata]